VAAPSRGLPRETPAAASSLCTPCSHPLRGTVLSAPIGAELRRSVSCRSRSFVSVPLVSTSSRPSARAWPPQAQPDLSTQQGGPSSPNFLRHPGHPRLIRRHPRSASPPSNRGAVSLAPGGPGGACHHASSSKRQGPLSSTWWWSTARAATEQIARGAAARRKRQPSSAGPVERFPVMAACGSFSLWNFVGSGNQALRRCSSEPEQQGHGVRRADSGDAGGLAEAEGPHGREFFARHSRRGW